MQTLKRYVLIATPAGRTAVMVNEELRLNAACVVLGSYDTIDEAFDWKDVTDAAVQKALARHCATCG